MAARTSTAAASRDAMLAAALDYAGRGWSVVPVTPRAKRPLIAWRELQQRHAEDAEIRAWLERWPGANIAIVTGRLSGLVVLDVDPRHGGADSLARIEHAYGPMPDTLEVETGQGGRHIYFRYPGRHVGNVVGLLDGIDIRGDGGLVVAPPSVHPNGRQYAWRTAHGPEEARLAGLPDWVFRMLRERRPPGGHPPEHWRSLIADGVAEGARNDTIASITGHLLWHGVDPEVARELMLCWNRERCRPPLDDEEVERVVSSIARLHEREP